jgi:3-hydroxymyristoyl/3-hydroxydecanoyl-(acyl carrier protein) dehydratase
MNSKYKLKILAIACFILILLSSFIAYSHPAKGYELSIYESTPTFVWIFLIFSIAGGVTIIVHQVYTKAYKNSNFWLFGFLILILSRMTLLYIPFIRGYYTWRGDNISHIGFVKDVLLTGHFPTDNFYPVTHILLAECISISGAPIELIVNHSTALFSAFYVVSIYLLATAVLPKKSAQLLSVAAIGGVILFNRCDIYLQPNGWSILYLPLVLFFFFKSFKSLEYKLLLVIMLVLYPFFHPLSSTVLVIILVTIGFARVLLLIIEHKKISLNEILHSFPITQVLIVLGILLPWILSFQNFNLNIRNLYTALTTGHSPDVIAQMGSRLDKINLHGLEFIKHVIKVMGSSIIFLSLSVIAAIILLKSNKNHKEIKSNENLAILLGITFVIGIVYAAYLFNIIPGLGNIGSQRLLAYSVLFTPIFVGFSFQHFLSKRRKYITASLCIVIIMTASIISILSLYPSPYVIRPTPEVTQMDMHGFEWFVEYKSTDIGCTCIMSPPYRFADAILGTREADKRTDIHHTPAIPDHFGYVNHSTLGESYKKDRYAAITQMDKVIYDTVWEVVGRFHKEDFEKLESDKTVDKLYSNGECVAWYIYTNKRM